MLPDSNPGAETDAKKFVTIGAMWRSRNSNTLVGRIEAVPLAWQRRTSDAWELAITFIEQGDE